MTFPQPVRLLVYIASLTLAIVTWEAERFINKVDALDRNVSEIATTSAKTQTIVDGVVKLQDRIVTKLENHEHRITLLEAKDR